MDTELKRLRHGVSVLKKQGILPDRLDNRLKLDGRNALPSMKVKGKRLDTIIRKYDAIVSGKATALDVPQSQLPKYRKAGFETSEGKLIVPHAATERARILKGQVSIKSPKGIERVQIPVEFHNLKQYLSDIRKHADVINKLKGKREYFGIRFYGGQRANFYSDIRDLIDDLSRYQSFISKSTRYKQEEIYKHLEIIRMNSAGAREIENQREQRKREMSKDYNRRHARKQREKTKRSPSKLAAQRRAAAQRAKEYRERIKKDPVRYVPYLAKARARAKKVAKKKVKKRKR